MSIKFKLKTYSDKDKTIHGIEIYRSYYNETLKMETLGYIDTMHPLTDNELQILAKTIQEFIINNDRD